MESELYTCKKEEIRWQDVVGVRIFKKGCGSSWCPTCFGRGGLKRILQRLRSFDWRKCRHIVLTIDRSKFESGEACYYEVRGSKKIPGMIRNLRRTVGVYIDDWVCVLEWHKDGFPHWHLIVERTVGGAESMIGGDLLRKYWKFGAVRESYFKSQEHWESIVGYFGDNGYFDDEKGHQVALPEWAMYSTNKIRRFSMMVYDKVGADCKNVWVDARFDNYSKTWRVKRMRNYLMILSECGTKSGIDIVGFFGEVSSGFYTEVEIPYAELKRMVGGRYEEELGFCSEFYFWELWEFLGSDARLALVKMRFKDRFVLARGENALDERLRFSGQERRNKSNEKLGGN